MNTDNLQGGHDAGGLSTVRGFHFQGFWLEIDWNTLSVQGLRSGKLIILQYM